MRGHALDVGTDVSTAKLIKLTTALELSEAVPPATGRTLKKLARSVRLFAEVGELAAATAVLDEMTQRMDAEGEDDTGLDVARASVERAVTRVLRCLGMAGVQQARQDAAFRERVA